MGVLENLTGKPGLDDQVKHGIDKAVEAVQSVTRRRDPPVAVITQLGKDRLAEFGIPDSEWQVLNELIERPMGKNDLARSLGRDSKKVASVLDKLEQDGFVIRRSAGGGE